MIEFLGLPKLLKGKEDVLSGWLNGCAKGHKSRIKNLVYHFVDDAEIIRMNIKHLQHDYATDIITFGYSEGKKISGDIYIGYETVMENAKDLSVSLMEEMCRVVAHGMLHLIGFDDHSNEEKALMRNEEEKCLILRPKILRSN